MKHFEMKQKSIILSIKLIFLILFLYTGISKFIGYKEFIAQIKQSPILNPLNGWIIIWIVPTAEIIVAIMLIRRKWQLQALFSSFLLMLLFTIYLILLNNFSYYIPCSCGGWLESLPPDIHIALNSLLMIIAITGIFLEKRSRANVKIPK
jgi:hypothetical protein